MATDFIALHHHLEERLGQLGKEIPGPASIDAAHTLDAIEQFLPTPVATNG